MPGPAKTREILIGMGFAKQADIATPNTAVGIFSMKKLNTSFATPKLNTENDALELGKGHEFATQIFNTSWDVQGQIEKYLSSDFAAWVMAFSLGNVVKSGTTPNFIYTCKPLYTPTDGIELPYFSFVEQIRPGAGTQIVDHMAIGCAIEDWTLTVGSGPGRANSKLVANFVGSGLYVEPSGITLPTMMVDKLLPSASLLCTINGTDYVSSKNIVSLEATYKNNLALDAGFFPGSGFQTADTPASGAVRGRMEVGDRTIGLQFVARFEHGSDELTKLKSQTQGVATVELNYDTNNDLLLTYQQVTFQVVDLTDTNGIVTVQVTCLPMWNATANGVLTAVAKCNTDGIAQAES